jgi:hypothetical protein
MPPGVGANINFRWNENSYLEHDNTNNDYHLKEKGINQNSRRDKNAFCRDS